MWPGIVVLVHRVGTHLLQEGDSSHSRDLIVSLLCCLSGTTTLGTIFDIPGLSVHGHQPGNR